MNHVEVKTKCTKCGIPVKGPKNSVCIPCWVREAQGGKAPKPR